MINKMTIRVSLTIVIIFGICIAWKVQNNLIFISEERGFNIYLEEDTISLEPTTSMFYLYRQFIKPQSDALHVLQKESLPEEFIRVIVLRHDKTIHSIKVAGLVSSGETDSINKNPKLQRLLKLIEQLPVKEQEFVYVREYTQKNSELTKERWNKNSIINVKN